MSGMSGTFFLILVGGAAAAGGAYYALVVRRRSSSTPATPVPGTTAGATTPVARRLFRPAAGGGVDPSFLEALNRGVPNVASVLAPAGSVVAGQAPGGLAAQGLGALGALGQSFMGLAGRFGAGFGNSGPGQPLPDSVVQAQMDASAAANQIDPNAGMKSAYGEAEALALAQSQSPANLTQDPGLDAYDPSNGFDLGMLTNDGQATGPNQLPDLNTVNNQDVGATTAATTTSLGWDELPPVTIDASAQYAGADAALGQFDSLADPMAVQ